MQFTKATKKKSKLRLALMSPSGYGKTYTALAIGTNLGKRVAVIDTERGSASLYSDKFAFDVLELDSFEPQKYIDAIHAAETAGYDVLVIDSLTHAWTGSGGALEMADTVAAKSSARNTFTAWREVTPIHNAMVDAILRSPLHIIVTMRVKTEWVLEENERGKKVPVKKGLEPVQRKGMEYEFTVVADMHENHAMTVSKTRCSALDGKMFKLPGKDVADVLINWLNDGAEAQTNPAPQPAATPLESALAASVESLWPQWLSRQQSVLRNGAKGGAGGLLEAWAEVTEDVAKLCPPSDVVAAITATKDELKKNLGAS